MPRLPQQTAQSRGNVLILPGVSADTFGAGAGREMQQAGHEISAVAEKIQAQQDPIDLAYMAHDYDIGLDAIKTKVAAHPDTAQHAALFEIQAKELQDSIINKGIAADNFSSTKPPRPHVVNAFKALIHGKNATAFIDLAHHSATVDAQRVLSTFADTEQRMIQEAAMDPEKRDENIAFVNKTRSNLVEGGLMNEVEAQKGRLAADHRFWSTFAQYRPEDMLNISERSKESGGLPGGLDATHLDEYTRISNLSLAGQRAEAARLAAQEKEAFAALQDQTRHDFVEKWTKGTLDPHEILSSNLPPTGQGSKEHYIALMVAKEKRYAEPFVKDPRLYADTLKKIRDRKITSENQIENIFMKSANQNHGIDDEDMGKLRKEFDDARTPDGQLLGSRKQRIFDKLQPSIDRSIFGQKSDEAGSALFLQYQEWVDKQLNAYRQQGKNPHDLLDPENKDLYLGRPSAIAPYQRSMRDTIQEMTDKFKRPDRAVVPDAKKRLDGETPSQYLERMKKK